MTTESNPHIGLEHSQESIWLRGLFMLLFVVIYGVAEVVVLAVALIQFGWVVVTEERNERLLSFGGSLSEFVFEVLRYWTFVSEEKPFPFSKWPEEQAGSDPK